MKDLRHIIIIIITLGSVVSPLADVYLTKSLLSEYLDLWWSSVILCWWPLEWVWDILCEQEIQFIPGFLVVSFWRLSLMFPVACLTDVIKCRKFFTTSSTEKCIYRKEIRNEHWTTQKKNHRAYGHMNVSGFVSFPFTSSLNTFNVSCDVIRDSASSFRGHQTLLAKETTQPWCYSANQRSGAKISGSSNPVVEYLDHDESVNNSFTRRKT